jgi:radical SAM superfamily enzyme YgiQ (UPF0313 family)
MKPRTRFRKVVLVNPSRLCSDGWATGADVGRNHPALEILRGALASRVDNVDILDLPNLLGVPENDAQRDAFLRGAARLVGERSWDGVLVGISCWSSLHYLSTLEVARLIKAASASARIVVGGYHPTAVPGDFLEHPDLFDHVVQGPGEGAMLRLLAGSRQRVFPVRPLRGVPNELLFQRPPTVPTDTHYVYLSRGCPFACSYCVESAMTSRSWRALSPTRAAQLVVDIDRTGMARRIGITDACFGALPRWRHAFLRRLVKAGIRTPLWVETRAETFTQEDVELFSQLHCQVDFGLDSGSETMLRIMRKTSNPRRYLERTAQVTRELDRRGVPVTLYLIFNHPGETEATVRETLAYLSSLRSSLTGSRTFFSAGTYFFVPGTAVAEELESLTGRFGTVVHEKTWWKQRQPHYPLAINVVASSGVAGSTIHGGHWSKAMERLARPMGAWRFMR